MVQSSDETLSQADYEALATLRYTLRKFTDFSTSAAQEAGLPPQQHQALLAIKGNRLGEAMRAAGGTVVWVVTTFGEASLENWPVLHEMAGADH